MILCYLVAKRNLIFFAISICLSCILNDLYIIFDYYRCKFSKYLTISLKAQSLSQATNILILFLDKASVLYSFSRHTCQTLNPEFVSPSFFWITTATCRRKKKKVVSSDENSITRVIFLEINIVFHHAAEMLKAYLPYRHIDYQQDISQSEILIKS